MAALTFLAHRIFVHAVFLMAGVAIEWCFAVLVTRLVAFVAGGPGVLAVQQEISEFVIEGGLIEDDDRGIAAFVICVAARTIASVRSPVQAVVSLAVRHVTRDVVMTIEAELALPAAFK